jgi:hypothetical protein
MYLHPPTAEIDLDFGQACASAAEGLELGSRAVSLFAGQHFQRAVNLRPKLRRLLIVPAMNPTIV